MILISAYIARFSLSIIRENRNQNHMPFDLNAKRFFLTYPQCDTPKATAAGNLRARYADALDFFAIVAEHHAGTEADPVGGPHLHMLVVFKDKQHIRDPTAFDFICDKHGDYRVNKGALRHTAVYLTKEDKEPLCFNCDLEAMKAGQSKIFQRLSLMVKEGKTLEQIDDEEPGSVLAHKRKLEEYIEFHEAKRRRVQVQLKGHLELNDDTIEIGYPRAFRSPQYYVWGPPGIGKTSIINLLVERGFRGFHLPYNGPRS